MYENFARDLLLCNSIERFIIVCFVIVFIHIWVARGVFPKLFAESASTRSTQNGEKKTSSAINVIRYYCFSARLLHRWKTKRNTCSPIIVRRGHSQGRADVNIFKWNLSAGQIYRKTKILLQCDLLFYLYAINIFVWPRYRIGVTCEDTVVYVHILNKIKYIENIISFKNISINVN